MPRSHQPSSAPMPARDSRPSIARPGLLPASALLAVVLLTALALASAAFGWQRADLLQTERYPALQDRRQLRIMAAEARFAAQDNGDRDGAMRLARADSIGERFHRRATAAAARDLANGESAGTADERFTGWYVHARRAAQGLSLSDEAAGSSAELSAVAYRRLDDELASEISAANAALERDAMLAERARTLAWSLAGLGFVSLAYGLAAGRSARATAAPTAPARTTTTPSDAAPALRAWTQPVRAVTPAATTAAIPSQQPSVSASRRATAQTSRRPPAASYDPRWGAASSLVPATSRAAGRPMALYEAIHVLEYVLRDTTAGMKRAEAPLAIARSNTRSTANASARLATTAAALAVQATQLQALLASFRVVRAAAC